MSETNPPLPELCLSLTGLDADTDLYALREWLTAEDTFRGRVRVRPRPNAPGEMGGLVDVLMVAVGSGGAGVVLARSLITWLTQRRADVVVTLTDSDGRRVRVDVRRARDPQAVIREVGDLVNHDRNQQ